MMMKQPRVLLVVLFIFSVGLLLGRKEKDYDYSKMFFARGRNNGSEFTTKGDFKILAGFWLGIVADLRILYRITPQGQVFIYSLDQGGALIPAGTTSMTTRTGRSYSSSQSSGAPTKQLLTRAPTN